MSTLQEIEAAIPQLPRREAEALRAWLDEFLTQPGGGASRSIEGLPTLSGKWIGEDVIKSGDIAEEMFDRR
jgi:hypothetical protein